MPSSPLALLARWLRFDRGELKALGLGVLIPFLFDAAARCWAVHTTQSDTGWKGYILVQYGELEFWSFWLFGWWFGLRLFARGWLYWPLRLAFHCLSALHGLLAVLDVAFYVTTGNPVDLDLFLYGLDQFSRVWPVIASELMPAHYLGSFLVVALSLAPQLVRRTRGTPAPVGGWLIWLALVPTLYFELDHRPKAPKNIRELQKGLVETWFWDGLASWGERSIPPQPAELERTVVRATADTRPLDVVIVFLESVGFRHTSLADPDLETTPNLARLAREGVLVQQAWSVVPHTTKALIATLCGTEPHLVHDIAEARPGGAPSSCLGRALRSVGYRTAFFQAATETFEDRRDVVHEMGFQDFFPREVLQDGSWEKNNYFGIDDQAMLAPGLGWARRHRDEPTLQVFLTLASHHDYRLPSHTRPPGHLLEFASKRKRYADAVRYVDDFLGSLVESYGKAGLLDDKVFVILGDHGEGFNEHGRSIHDLVIYEEGLRIPMVLWGPGLGRAGAVDGLRSQLDVMPTVLDLLGLEREGAALDGRSVFSPAIPGRLLRHSCWASHRCIASREGNRKLVDLYRDGEPQLFDLEKDPDEMSPIQSGESLRGQLKPGRDWRAQVNGRYDALAARVREASQRPDGSPALATWEGMVSLLGCTPQNDSLVPNQQLWLTCRWRAERAMDVAWQLHARVTATGGEQSVEPWDPGRGTFPTFDWRAGWSLDDDIRVAIPGKAAPGPARVEVAISRYGGQPVESSNGQAWVDVGTVEITPRFPNRSPYPPPAGLGL
jgi:arylsulfatase A-like enzyme